MRARGRPIELRGSSDFLQNVISRLRRAPAAPASSERSIVLSTLPQRTQPLTRLTNKSAIAPYCSGLDCRARTNIGTGHGIVSRARAAERRPPTGFGPIG